jgi:hypothetical protein
MPWGPEPGIRPVVGVQALDGFLRTKMDLLVMGDVMIRRA